MYIHKAGYRGGAVFGSGKMIGVGARSVEDAEKDPTIAYNFIKEEVE